MQIKCEIVPISSHRERRVIFGHFTWSCYSSDEDNMKLIKKCMCVCRASTPTQTVKHMLEE